MGRKNESMTIAISKEQREKLALLAFEMGYRWGDQGNISAMIQAISDGDLLLREGLSAGRAKEARALADALIKILGH